MLYQIFKYEFQYWLKKPVVYFYAVAFFGFSLLSFLGEGGYFLESVPNSPYQEIFNSPSSIVGIYHYMGKLFLFLLPAILGVSIYKDFKYRAHHIIYTFPIKKHIYLLGKFLSAYSVILLVSLSAALAFILGEFLLGVENPKIEPFSWVPYIQAYTAFVIPNLFFYGVLVFAVVALTRNIYAGFVTVVILFFVQLITENVFTDSYHIALSDPFGQNTFSYAIKDWDLFQRNSLSIPMWDIILYNRLLWFGFSIVISVLLYKVFSFSQLGIKVFVFKKKSSDMALKNPSSTRTKTLSDVAFNFSIGQQIKTVWRLSVVNFKHCITSPMFYVFSVLGLFTTVVMLVKISQLGDLAMLPLTTIMLSIPAYFFVSIIIIITFVYSGMLVHRDKTAKIDGLINSTPISNTVLLWSKVLGLIKVQYLLLTILMLCGISVQLSLGYYDIDLPQYFMNLYVVTGITLIVWSLVSVFLHSLLSNVYLGMFLLLFLWILKSSVTHLGIDTQLLQFNTPPDLSYSDLYGYGSELLGYFTIEFYWLAITLLLVLVSYLMWRREKPFSIAERIRIAKKRFNAKNRLMALGLVIIAVSLGVRIYISENEIDTNRTSPETFQEFTKEFGHFSGMNQPRIQSISMEMAIYPDELSFSANGRYELQNMSESSIDTILIKTGFDETTSVKLSKENTLLNSDSNMRFFVYKLDKALAPNETFFMDFEVKSIDNTLFQVNSNVLENGTFIKSDILPRLGYYVPGEKKHPIDSTALNNHYQAIDSDLIDFECTISTSKDQIAVATGKLKKQWTENNRNYFQYQTETPIKIGMAFNSGEFTIEKNEWNGVEISMYHHQPHGKSAKRMIEGMKATLEYNSQYFGEYLNSNVNIIEFPSTQGSFATAFGNALLISETRFGVKSGEDKIDLSFYVAAHEMTHHWFGNRLLPKDVLGATLLTESISEYITLNIYRKSEGESAAKQFLEKQRTRYLRGSWRKQPEVPLLLATTSDDHLTYGKGSIAFNAISYYWGEENMLQTLKQFMDDFSADSAEYPTSANFVDHLNTHVPDTLQYLVHDMIETVVYNQNGIDTATAMKQGNEYALTVSLSISKTNVDKEELALADYIELGVYNDDEELLKLVQIKATKAKETILVRTTDKPSKLVLDPNLLIIERNTDDNEFILHY
jgi:ABC-2 type transport system permease protein